MGRQNLLPCMIMTCRLELELVRGTLHMEMSIAYNGATLPVR